MNIEEGKDADKASVITTDKLRKFNEIYGFEHGPAIDGENEEEEAGFDEDVSNPNEGDEQRDEVHSLGQAHGLKSKALLKRKLRSTRSGA